MKAQNFYQSATQSYTNFDVNESLHQIGIKCLGITRKFPCVYARSKNIQQKISRKGAN